MNRAGRRTGSHAVHQDHRSRTLPDIEQSDRFALEYPHPDARTAALPQPARNRQTRSVVAAQRVSDPDDEHWSLTLDRQVEEVGRARDAGVMVADRLLTAQPQLFVRQVDVLLDHGTEVLLYR